MQSVKKIFEVRLYIYRYIYVPNFGEVWGGGQFDPPPEISAGKVRNGPRMAQMDGKQVILTNKTV